MAGDYIEIYIFYKYKLASNKWEIQTDDSAVQGLISTDAVFETFIGQTVCRK